jgi:uncharacterized protein involved in response to NO
MNIADEEVARPPTPTFLTQGFRPLFLAAGFWSAAAIALWVGVLTAGIELPSRFDPLTWHIHEMLFGFVMAVIAGFMLTAIPNWTKRVPVSEFSLGTLAGLWLLGRIACLISAFVPAWLAIIADLSFPALLIAVATREIIAAGNWRNLPVLAPVTLLGAADLLMHLEANGAAVPAGLGWRLGLAAVIVLIAVVAGRIVPSFTRNWPVQRHSPRLPAAHGWIDRGALGILHSGLLGWAILPEFRPSGLLLVLGAMLNVWRLFRWRGGATISEPLLFVLHVGYAWLAVGSALLGLATLGLYVPQSAGVLALTAGAVGTMILAMMTRVARGHTGRKLSADRETVVIYILVNTAALARVAAAFGKTWTTPLLIASASLWIGAFVLFITFYGPMLLLPHSPSHPR